MQRLGMIVVPVGTRAELIKLSSLLRGLEKRHELAFVNLNQHPLEETIEALDIPSPALTLEENLREAWQRTGPFGLWRWYGKGLKTLRKLVREGRGKKVVIGHGNTFAMHMAMRLGKMRAVTAVHIEAGVRSFFPIKPDFKNWRRARFADYMYRYGDTRAAVSIAVMKSCVTNMDREGIETQKICTGDPMVEIVRDALKRRARVKPPKEYILANATRSIDSRAKAKSVIDAMKKSRLRILYTINPKIEARLRGYGLWKSFSDVAETYPPLNYVDFVRLMAKARAVMTDSNTTQEECAVLNKPCIVTNDFAQFPELVDGCAVRVAGCDSTALTDALRDVEDNAFARVTIGDGKATERTLKTIKELVE